MATCRAEPLATDRIGCRLAAVDEVLRSIIAPQPPINGHSELKLDALRNIQPMELGVKQMCQATVELVSSTDDPSCCIAHAEDDGWWLLSDDPASTALQPSTRDETKACTGVPMPLRTQCQSVTVVSLSLIHI